MRWIILALTLGASITSVIHGVFMLFGSLSISGGAAIGIPSTLLASLPIASAVLALIGGIIAFNQIRWGALFLIMATVVCAFAPRDIWLYGGLYFFAALLCFFLKPRQDNHEPFYNYDDEDFNFDSVNGQPEEEYYENEDYIDENNARPLNNISIDINNVDDDIKDFQSEVETPKLRRRTSKICPECGSSVSRENRFCPNCGAKLHVTLSDEELAEIQNNVENNNVFLGNQDNNTILSNPESVNKILTGQSINETVITDNNIQNENGGDDMQSVVQSNPNYKVFVSPKRSGSSVSKRSAMSQEAASYQEFSKYTRRGKKRKRSAGKRILSMLLLIGAVGGALYFLLGLRKLPPGDLPPMVRTEVAPVIERSQDVVAQPVEVVVAENILPNFTPDRNPRNGIITGSGVNMRADHSTGSRSITKLNNNTRVELLNSWTGQSGNLSGPWYQIRTGSREGWVYGRYIQPVGSGLPSGYSNALLKSLGSNRAELIESLGQPTRSTSSSVEWSGLSAGLRGDEIIRLTLSSSRHELQNGLKTGMSQTALYQIMGYPSSFNNSQRTMQYNEDGKAGLRVQLNRDGLISSITVNEVR